MVQKTLWSDWKYIERFRVYQETVPQIESETDVGPLVNHEVFIVILAFAEIN